jgi:hypothetical protein
MTEEMIKDLCECMIFCSIIITAGLVISSLK